MLPIVGERLRQGHRTIADPAGARLDGRFRGRPLLDRSKCDSDCRACVDACPSSALRLHGDRLQLDLGACVFCGECALACPTGAVTMSNDHRHSATSRDGLLLEGAEAPRVEALGRQMRRLFGRSLRLRQVSAGGCNGCEAELIALGNVVFDMGRFGVQFVASPRHADGVVITGPVTTNMERALLETWEAVPAPKIAIAVGACAISGGVFAGSPAVRGVPASIPIDLHIAGCPPHPLTVLDGLLGLLGRR